MVIKRLENLKGFTLVELIIVISIILILAIMAIGAFNPRAMVNKAWDTQRKKDLGLIRVAFEQYFDDVGGFYPDSTKVASLNNKNNCDKSVFAPYLNKWPCDPVTKQPYYVLTEPGGDQPRWFKVFANLGNKSDKGIPQGWYEQGDTFHLGLYGINDYNYGISSTNVNWYEGFIDDSCTYDELDHTKDLCFITPPDGGCKSAGGGGNGSCKGTNCYARNDCALLCKVPCCGFGCY